MLRERKSWIFLVLAAAFLLGGCCQGIAEPQTDGYRLLRTPEGEHTASPDATPKGATLPDWLPPVNPADYTGDILIAGSSTVYPLAERMAERFQEEGFRGQITIDSIGSGAGFERFCVSGETDIANASRPIKDSEREACLAIGRDPVEFRVGTDGLAVVVSRENTFVEQLTLDELARVFSSAETWADVRPEWPAKPILRYIPGTDSGTFDFFVEAVFDKNEAPILTAANVQMSEDDNVLVQGIEGSPYAIGFFGYAYYEENADRLRPVAIEGVLPSATTVEAGEYPLSRPLLLYSSPEIMQRKPQVAAFVNFFLVHVNEEILDVGYFPASADMLEQAMRQWLRAAGKAP